MPLSREQVNERFDALFRQILRLETGVDLNQVTRAAMGERWSSLRHAELIVALQTELGVRLTYEEIMEGNSYSHLKQFLTQRLS